MQQMKWEANSHRKNREAEEAHVRKTAWGSNDSNSEEEMGDVTYLGDITHHHPPQQQAKASSGLAKTLGAAGLAAAGLGAGTALPIVAWNLTRPNAPAVIATPDTDTNTQYGLRIIKDEQPTDQ